MKYKYSILTVNFGGYETFVEPGFVRDDVEYVCVTDNPDFKSNVWKVIYRPGMWFLYPKHNPFEFVSSDVVLWLDGSYKILADPTESFVQPFIDSGKEFAISLHNDRHNVYEEMCYWLVERNFNVKNAESFIRNLVANHFNSDTLFQTSCILYKRTSFVEKIFSDVRSLEELHGVEGNYRDDQTLFSYSIVNNAYRDNRVLLMDFSATAFNPYFMWCVHGTNTPWRPKQKSFRCFDIDQQLLYQIK